MGQNDYFLNQELEAWQALRDEQIDARRRGTPLSDAEALAFMMLKMVKADPVYYLTDDDE